MQSNGSEDETVITSNKKFHSKQSLHPKEILFVSKIASHSCVFNVSLGQTGLLNMSEIVAKGRAALAAGTRPSAVRPPMQRDRAGPPREIPLLEPPPMGKPAQ